MQIIFQHINFKSVRVLMENHVDWRKVEDKELDEVKALDDICFEYGDMYYLREIEPKRGEIYRLYSHKENMILGYSVYGQIYEGDWDGDAYIMRIGIHPEYRRQGYASWIIQAILRDLSQRKTCQWVYCDIRQSNKASINLFTKNGFKLFQVRDKIYDNVEASHCMYYGLK